MSKTIKMSILFIIFALTILFVGGNCVNAATTENDADAIMKKLAPDLQNATFYMKKPTTMEDADFSITNYICNKIGGSDYYVYGGYDIGQDICTVTFQSSDYQFGEWIGWDDVNNKPIYGDPIGWTKSYNIKVNFVAPKSNSTVDSYINKLKNLDTMNPNPSEYYFIEDLSLINYYLTSNKSELWNPGAPGRALKYSSLNETTKGSNITYYLDVRAGNQDETLMFESAFGPMSVFYNGYLYGTKDPEGIYLKRVIYIPQNTANTTDAFAKAAQERINEYLGNTSVVVSYGGTLSSLPEEAQDVDYPVTNHDGNYYNVKIGTRTYKFYIVKSTEDKLVKPTYLGTDISSNIQITSEDASIPLDTSLNVKNVNDTSIKDKIGTENYKSYDISLFSNAKGTKIEKLLNGEFEVKIPVPSELEGKTLVAIYITSEGEKEEHEVTIKDGYATFTTDHFSVYTLAEKVAQNPSENENPSDNVNPNENKEDKGPKDESPKTGVMDIINYVLVVTIFAGVGIVALKKQN